MYAAVSKPFEELPAKLQQQIDDTELLLQYELAEDLKHCEGDLNKLAGRRPSPRTHPNGGGLAFKEFEAERSYIRKKIAVMEAQRHRLANAAPADRLVTMARLIAERLESADARITPGAPAPPPAEAPKDRPYTDVAVRLAQAADGTSPPRRRAKSYKRQLADALAALRDDDGVDIRNYRPRSDLFELAKAKAGMKATAITVRTLQRALVAALEEPVSDG